jgi:glycosyltransferase involved in cell wall biosynthesis
MHSDHAPLVSVVIPTHNREHSIGRAVRGVMDQTFTNLEIVVVDDASTDGTMRLLKSLAACDHRLRFVRLSAQSGAQHARNVGIEAACGSYVAFLDSDNEWDSDKLERQMELLLARPTDDLVAYCGIRRVVDGAAAEEELPTATGNVYRVALSRWLADTSTLVVPRSVLVRAGSFREGLSAYQEWDLCIRLARMCEFDCVPACLVTYRCGHDDAVSADLVGNATGYADVVAAHRDEIVGRCGRKTLGHHYVSSGHMFLVAGKRELALRFYGRAIGTSPRPSIVLNVLAGLGGQARRDALAIVRRTSSRAHG